MDNKLETMLAAQDDIARRFIPMEKFISKEMPEVDVQQWSHRYLCCAIEEIIEACRELHARKFWSKKHLNKPMDEGKFREEFADILHFLFAVARINAWSADEVFKAYMDKYHKNLERFEETVHENGG